MALEYNLDNVEVIVRRDSDSASAFSICVPGSYRVDGLGSFASLAVALQERYGVGTGTEATNGKLELYALKVDEFARRQIDGDQQQLIFGIVKIGNQITRMRAANMQLTTLVQEVDKEADTNPLSD